MIPEADPDIVNAPDNAKVVALVVPRLLVPAVLVNPEEAVNSPPLVKVLLVVNVVNTPVLAVILPIDPGLAKVAPFNKDAFKLATTVVLVTVNGAVPVLIVLVNVFPETFPLAEIDVAVATPNTGVIRLGELLSTLNPVPVFVIVIKLLDPSVCTELLPVSELKFADVPVIAPIVVAAKVVDPVLVNPPVALSNPEIFNVLE